MRRDYSQNLCGEMVRQKAAVVQRLQLALCASITHLLWCPRGTGGRGARHGRATNAAAWRGAQELAQPAACRSEACKGAHGGWPREGLQNFGDL